MNYKIAAYIKERRNDEDLLKLNESSNPLGIMERMAQNLQLDYLESTNDRHLFDEPNSFKLFMILSVIFNMGFVLYLISGFIK